MRWCGNGWGNHVVIEHGDSVFTRYAHLLRVYVLPGTQVTAGAPIGELGATGLSQNAKGISEPHLHFELGVHGGPSRTCDAPQNFWMNAGPVPGGVYDPVRLPFGDRGEHPTITTIDGHGELMPEDREDPDPCFDRGWLQTAVAQALPVGAALLGGDRLATDDGPAATCAPASLR